MSTGDYDLRGREIEQVFTIEPIPDNCVDAANQAAAKFDRRFPGWQIYCRIIRGDALFDRQILAWAVASARLYARMRKRNGQAVVRAAARGPWIAQAAADAVDYVVFGRFADTGKAASERFGVDDELYTRFRKELASLMTIGFQSYVSVLHYQYTRTCILSRMAA